MNRQKEDPAHLALVLGNSAGKAASRPVFEVWDNHGLPGTVIERPSHNKHYLTSRLMAHFQVIRVISSTSASGVVNFVDSTKVRITTSQRR